MQILSADGKQMRIVASLPFLGTFPSMLKWELNFWNMEDPEPPNIQQSDELYQTSDLGIAGASYSRFLHSVLPGSVACGFNKVSRSIRNSGIAFYWE